MTKKDKRAKAERLNKAGNVLIIAGLVFLYLTFGPAFRNEINYAVNKSKPPTEEELVPPDTSFSVVIPKIRAAAPVFANIDPFNKSAYLPVLYKGVAHAKGTSLPGNPGNVYLFAHSTDAFYNVGRYNAVFYLLGKLQKDDVIEVYYQDQKYQYKVDEVKVVSANAVKYLKGDNDSKTLTLQTCYPPGTTLKRLVVIAKEVEKEIK